MLKKRLPPCCVCEWNRVCQKGEYLPVSAGRLLSLRMLLAKKIPVKNHCGEMQNCGRMHLHYTNFHPSDFLISWVSKATLCEQYTNPKEIKLNCIQLYQNRTVFFWQHHCQTAASLVDSRAGPTGHGCCWYQRTGLDGSGLSFQPVFHLSSFPQISTCKKNKKNKRETRPVCFLKCPAS